MDAPSRRGTGADGISSHSKSGAGKSKKVPVKNFLESVSLSSTYKYEELGK